MALILYHNVFNIRGGGGRRGADRNIRRQKYMLFRFCFQIRFCFIGSLLRYLFAEI